MPARIRLETDRVILRALTWDDLDDIYAYASDPEVAASTTWEAHKTRDDSREFLGRVMSWYDDGFGGPWGLQLRATGRVIGTCGLAITPQHGRAELGYALGRAHWGQGLMTEVVREVIRYGFEELGLNRIEARCIPTNIGSARGMQKARMTNDGTIRGQVTVENTTGTGFVHIAPGHGMEDYQLGLQNGLPIYSPVDDDGALVAPRGAR